MKYTICFILALFISSCKEKTTEIIQQATPVVTIISPANNSAIAGSTTITIQAAGANAITQVELYIDNTVDSGRIFSTSPYTYIWNVENLTDSSGHTIYARAFDSKGNVSYSPIVHTTTYNFRPTNVHITNGTDTSITVTWQDNCRIETGFDIEQSSDGTIFLPVKTVGPNVTSAIIYGTFGVNNTYTFRVRAKTNTEASAYSPAATTTVLFPAPSNLNITTNTDTEVGLEWQDNSHFESAFDIEESIDGGSFTVVKTVGENITSATISGTYYLTTSYSFRVRAKTNHSTSNYSNTAMAALIILPQMISIPGGTFWMGDTLNDNAGSDEHPVHSVTVDSFYIGKYEVTQAQWKSIVIWKQANGGTTLNATPGNFTGDSTRPVENISWNDANMWIGYLNEMFGSTKYRLPTEAEWEYAARAGEAAIRYAGTSDGTALGNYAWYNSNSGSQTHSVGEKLPNAFGLYDMSGNVGEWCNDWYSATYYSTDPQTNPAGPSQGTFRVLRGGSWNYPDNNNRIAYRYKNTPSVAYFNTGFRIAKSR